MPMRNTRTDFCQLIITNLELQYGIYTINQKTYDTNLSSFFTHAYIESSEQSAISKL